MGDFLLEREVGMLSLWIVEEKEDNGDGDGTNRKIDVEAPAPGDT